MRCVCTAHATLFETDFLVVGRLVKEARTIQHTPYHQDQPYYNIEGTQNVSFWLPVDRVPLESSLCFVSGSHTGKWYLPTTFLSQTAQWFPEGSLEPVPDIDGDPSAFELLQWAVEPGDALAFHMLTLHGSRGTTGRRRAFSVRVTGDDVVHAPRPWRTSPE
jgi:ectoine hydroxylase-related dioxygenase (phytanoyl-CoA dioxygenase family)